LHRFHSFVFLMPAFKVPLGEVLIMIKQYNDQIRALLGLALLFGCAALPAVQYIPTFFDMDKDGDGVVSAEEAEYWSALKRARSRVDTNHDGVIDMQEWNAIDTKALAAEGKR